MELCYIHVDVLKILTCTYLLTIETGPQTTGIHIKMVSSNMKKKQREHTPLICVTNKYGCKLMPYCITYTTTYIKIS